LKEEGRGKSHALTIPKRVQKMSRAYSKGPLLQSIVGGVPENVGSH